MSSNSDEPADEVSQDDKPLYERDEYQPDNTVDLVLLLAAEDGATYGSVREQLEEIEEDAMRIQVDETGDPIPPDLGPDAQPEHREPDRALRFLTLHDYVDAYDSWGETVDAEIELTNRGHSAVDALRRGLLPEQREALEDVDAETAPRVTDGGKDHENEFVVIDTHRPDDAGFTLRLGIRGTCNHCETELVDGHEEGQVRCPDCGLVVGLVVVYPEANDRGSIYAENGPWPYVKQDWEVEDGRTTIDVGYAGTHHDCDSEFGANEREVSFGSAPPLACPDCGVEVGFASQLNVIEDPLEAEA